MGNILISNEQIERWKRENDRAEQLSQMQSLNTQEEQMIASVLRERTVKVCAVVALTFSYGLSLKRYFPDSVITRQTPMFVLTTLSIMLPSYAVARIYTNREIIAKLELIEENHKLINHQPK